MNSKIREIVVHRYFNNLSSLILLLFYLNFIYSHLLAIKGGAASATLIIFVLMETVVIVNLITRSNPKDRTITVAAWFYAIAATFLPLTFSPYGISTSIFVGETLMIIGGLCAVASYLSLNKSFGITPALRNVKTSGMYRIVRHPMYLSYIVLYLGYINISFNSINLLIVIALVFFLVKRIGFEEALLIKNAQYENYTKEVKYRLIPFIY